MAEEYDIFANNPEAQARYQKQGSGSQQSAPDESAPVEEEQGFIDRHFGSEQNAALPFLQGLSLGWSDEALAGVLAAYGTFMPELAGGLPDKYSLPENFEQLKSTLAEAKSDYGKSYDTAVGGIRDDTKAYSDKNEIAAMALEGVGGMATGGAGLWKTGGKQLAKEATKRF